MAKKRNLKMWVVMSVLFLAMVSTTANGYCFFGEFTVDGNNSRENPLRISGIPAPCYVRITYSSGYFTNGGPMPGWGAYAGDCITVAGALGQIGCPFRACCGPAGCYYYDLNQLLSCLTNLPPFEFSLEQGDWIEVHVWDDPGAGCNTATRRCGSMSFTVDVAVPRATYYVDAGATGANDGSSWEDALTDLQDALSVAAAPPGVVEEIRVAQGIYKPDQGVGITPGDRTATFLLKNGLAIKGGYAGFGEPDPNARDIHVYETILSGDIGWVGYHGDNSYHVITGSGTDETAVLDGFTITAGNANGPYGPPESRGGGMYNANGNPTVRSCTFSLNAAHRFGGGMYNERGSPTLANCTFSGNSAENGDGGGMYNWYSNATLTNCTFSGNIVAVGGGGMYNYSGSPTVTNCTFTGNSAGHYGGGVAEILSHSRLTNCILWRDTPDEIYVYGRVPVVTYSDVQGGWMGEGNIDADPCFVEPGYWADANDPNIAVEPNDPNAVWVDGDYHLMPGSPCIDAGDNSRVPADTTDLDGDGNTTEPVPWDLDGNPRIVDGNNDGNSVVDMGAYEAVVPPMIEVPMKFTPQALNPSSKGNWVKAHLVLPECFGVDDVDANEPATVEPFGIESEYINVFVNEDGLVEIEVAFGRAAFCGAATDYGPVEVTVIGLLTSGQYFYGTDTIKIINKTFEYLGVLASHWLEAGCGAPDWCGGVDLDHSFVVDFVDFAMFDGCCIEVIRQ